MWASILTSPYGATRKTHIADPEVLSWTDFWSALDRCRRDEWPQLILLPRLIVNRMQAAVPRSSGLYPRGLVAEMLRAASAPDERPDSDPDLVTLEPDGNGNYRITRDLSDNHAESEPGDTTGVPDDHRQVVFQGARTLFQ